MKFRSSIFEYCFKEQVVLSFRIAILFQACLLLSLESLYSPAYQMALDMLHRLNTAHEEIVEVLLSKKQVIPSMRQV